jgi:hypothetical protein
MNGWLLETLYYNQEQKNLSEERLRVREDGGDIVSSRLPGQVLPHIQGVV